MNDILKIISINAYIQHTGKLFLDGKEVFCVSLDRTCTFKGTSKGTSEQNTIALSRDKCNTPPKRCTELDRFSNVRILPSLYYFCHIVSHGDLYCRNAATAQDAACLAAPMACNVEIEEQR